MGQGLFIVVSAPSGAGKSTLCDMLLKKHESIRYSISCTTRAPRGEEQNGVDYHFVSREQFLAMREEEAFIESAEVHGCHYGTPAAEIETTLAQGLSVIMDIDVQGASQIRKHVEAGGKFEQYGEAFVDIFITVPSVEALRQRLEARGEDAPDVIERRLFNAAKEMADAHRYRYTIVNESLQDAFEELDSIYEKERKRINQGTV